VSNEKKYTKEFKLEAVRLVTENGYSLKEASESLDIPYKTLSRWKSEDKKEEVRINKKLSPNEEELKRLRKEISRLKMEKEILKKAAAFFAKENN